MSPTKFRKFVQERGKSESYKEGHIFHAQNFPQKLYFLEKGYVKRYQATKPKKRILELIYGPGEIVSLSQLYKKVFGLDQNQDNFIYVYEAMTDVEMFSIDLGIILKQLDEEPLLYKDFFYQSGLNLRANIFRLASNSLGDDYQKIAHQLVSLAYEFAGVLENDIRKQFRLPLPQTAVDLAEQLNISKEVVDAVLDSLCKNKIIKVQGKRIAILDIDLLKDIYLSV